MSNRELTFHGGARTAVGFIVAFSLVLMAAMPVKAAVADSPALVRLAFRVSMFAVIAGIGLVALRREDVRIADLGLSLRHLPPALVTFGGVWAALNLLGVGLAAATGTPWGLDRLQLLTPEFMTGITAPQVTILLYYFLVVGTVEEFTMRGYLQTKVVALLGDGSRSRIALGILTASIVFGLAHVPGSLVGGASVRAALFGAAMAAASGIAFGILYETTRNLYFLALLHGLGDTWPLVVDWANWSGAAFASYLLGVFVIYGGAALAYRYWAMGTNLTPVIRRREVGRTAAVGDDAATAGTLDSEADR